MRRRSKTAKHGTPEDPVDTLEEALRQVGADILGEPIPEALRQILRGQRGAAAAEPDPAGDQAESGDQEPTIRRN